MVDPQDDMLIEIFKRSYNISIQYGLIKIRHHPGVPCDQLCYITIYIRYIVRFQNIMKLQCIYIVDEDGECMRVVIVIVYLSVVVPVHVVNV